MTGGRIAAGLQRLAEAVSPLVNPTASYRAEELRAAVRDRIVLVTGASYGLGEATARELGRAGAVVLLVARSGERLEEVAAAIRGDGGTAHAFAVDLRDGAAIDGLVAEISRRWGAVDIIVNNAGKSIRRSVALSYDRFHDVERTMGVNCLGPIRLLLGLLPAMRARGRGHVVSISTIGVRLPPVPRWGAYVASKAAFDVWLRSAAPELRTDGVTVSTLYMALIHTRMSAPTPLNRYLPGLSPTDAARLVCRAVIDRPRVIEPWWAAPASWVDAAPRDVLEAAMGASYRMTADSPQARRRAGSGASPPVGRLGLARGLLRGLRKSRMLAPVRPDRVARIAWAARSAGGMPSLACSISAARYPDQVAVIDDFGSVTYRDLFDRGVRLAAALRETHRIGPERPLAILCRNHRGFIESMVAGARLGADLLLLNTEFPAPQLRQALADVTIGAVVVDPELAPALAEAGWDGPVVSSGSAGGGGETLDGLVARGGVSPPAAPRTSRISILTSGTTGRPKGAPRTPSMRTLVGPMATLLQALPLTVNHTMVLLPPLFHGFGLSQLALGLALGATIVLRRKFDPVVTLRDAAECRADAIVAVPVMYRRLLAARAELAVDLGRLRAMISSGAPLTPTLSRELTSAFGEVVFNFYGSSETGFGALATPADQVAAPGAAGRPPIGTRIAILDERGSPVRQGEVGAIYVGSSLAFDGYTGGGSKEVVGGLMATGDVGHFDAHGLLFVDGRADDMIVSGGENVFPQEVEEVLATHPDVAEVAVVGVPDPEFGQRLRAFIVPGPDGPPRAEDLRAHVKARVARYKVPRDIVFLAALPRNPTGKLQRGRLRERMEPDEELEARPRPSA